MTGLYDALLMVSFGGPEGPDDVPPFLENVLRGKHVPRRRMLEVADKEFQHTTQGHPARRESVAWCGVFQCGTSLRDVRNQGVEWPSMTVQQRTCIVFDACGTMGRRASGL